MKSENSDEEEETVSHLSFLIKFLETEYAPLIRKIDILATHGEITFDLIWAIFLPSMIVFTLCPTTAEPRAYRLRDIPRLVCNSRTQQRMWNLSCEYVDATTDFGLTFVNTTLEIQAFDGVVKITDLSAFPIARHGKYQQVQEKLLERAKRWVQLNGIHHVHYDGLAYKSARAKKVKVDSRIMIDRRELVSHLC